MKKSTRKNSEFFFNKFIESQYKYWNFFLIFQTKEWILKISYFESINIWWWAKTWFNRNEWIKKFVMTRSILLNLKLKLNLKNDNDKFLLNDIVLKILKLKLIKCLWKSAVEKKLLIFLFYLSQKNHNVKNYFSAHYNLI